MLDELGQTWKLICRQNLFYVGLKNGCEQLHVCPIAMTFGTDKDAIIQFSLAPDRMLNNVMDMPFAEFQFPSAVRVFALSPIPNPNDFFGKGVV